MLPHGCFLFLIFLQPLLTTSNTQLQTRDAPAYNKSSAVFSRSHLLRPQSSGHCFTFNHRHRHRKIAECAPCCNALRCSCLVLHVYCFHALVKVLARCKRQHTAPGDTSDQFTAALVCRRCDDNLIVFHGPKRAGHSKKRLHGVPRRLGREQQQLLPQQQLCLVRTQRMQMQHHK